MAERTAAAGISFLGSKNKLSRWILDEIEEVVTKTGDVVFGDLFCGAGSVSREAAERNWGVLINDNSPWQVCFTRAIVGPPPSRDIAHIAHQINERSRDADALSPGFIANNYTPLSTPVSRMYFTENNGKAIDTCRALIQSGGYDEATKNFLLALLIQKSMEIVNSPGHTRAFFKEWSKKSLQPLALHPTRLGASGLGKLVGWSCDSAENVAATAAQSCDVIYLDPPYTRVCYSKFYHILNSIYLNEQSRDSILVDSVAGTRKDVVAGEHWGNKNAAMYALKDLLRKISKAPQRRCCIVCLSYSNQGIMTKSEIKSIMKRYGSVKIVKKNHDRYSSSQNKSYLKERLFIVTLD
jgi:adenine-specific DNA-methyltransferase